VTSLAIAQFSSVGSGYRALNRATQDPQLEVVEFSPIGERSILLLRGPVAQARSFITNTKLSDLHKSLVIEDLDPRVLRAYLSLESATPKDSMAILESGFIGDLFAWANEAVKIGAGLVDFRWFRTSSPSGYLLLAGEETAAVLQWLLQHKQSGHRLTILPTTTEAFRKFIC
jgi:hypothetical protein